MKIKSFFNVSILILTGISFFLFFSCNKQSKKDNSIDELFENIDKIEIISYPSRMIWSEEDNPYFEKVTFIDEKVNIKKKYVRDRIILNDNQRDKLINLFKTKSCTECSAAACYEPRHIIVFYDKFDKVYGYYEMCIECGNNSTSENLQEISSFSIEIGEEFEKLFKEFGLKYIGDNKQINEDERRLHEENNH